MTDSLPPQRGKGQDKRQRLIDAACEVFYMRGVERTTLADIAAAAGIPLGNVYYYFKTKNDVIAAVIDAHLQHTRATLASIESRHRSPKNRLKNLVSEFVSQREIVAQYGCPYGSLCSELDKRADRPGVAAAELMRVPIEWAEGQFRLLGRRDAHDLAVHLLAVYEGSALLANTLREPDILSRQARRLDRWIDAL